MRLRKLFPLKREQKGLFYGFDTETLNVDKKDYVENRFIMGSVFSSEGAKSFWDKDAMKDYLLSRNSNSKIFATNLDFDINRLWDDPVLDFRLTVPHGKIILARHIDTGLRFGDTWNFQKVSVAKMGEILGVPKLEKPEFLGKMPKNQRERDILQTYCERDAEISYLYSRKFNDFCNSLECKMKNTISSTGLDYWRRNGQVKDIYTQPRDVIKLELSAFKGGRTETITRGRIQDRVYAYDYASHYPARCFYGIDGKGSYPDPNTWHKVKYADTGLVFESEGTAEVTYTSPETHLPAIATHIDNKLLFPSGKFTTRSTFLEIRYALKQGYKVSGLNDVVYYDNTFVPFRDVVSKLYALRRKYKIAKDTTEQMVKVMMNGGLFGKFGFNPFNKDNVFADSQVFIENDNLYILDDKGEKIFFQEFREVNGVFYLKNTSEDVKVPKYCIPILSTYTTALGRCKLHEDAVKAKDSLIYMDTDSIHTTKKMYDTSSELGGLELEYTSDESLYIRPKMYLSGESVKAKGIRKLDKMEFYSLCDNPHVDTQRFVGFRESKNRNLPHGCIIQIPKDISLEDTKRSWKHKFNPAIQEISRPLFIKDGITQIQRKKLQEKVDRIDEKRRNAEMKRFIDSDKFDSYSVGSDISAEEFIENEKFFALND